MKLKDGVKILYGTTTEAYKGSPLTLQRGDGGLAIFDYNTTISDSTPTFIWGGSESHKYYRFNPKTLAVQWSKITGKPTTLSGYGITDAYTKTTSDSRYVNVTGDTMSGDLNFSNQSVIKWNSGSWHQRIYVSDDSTANTAVFTFQQSSDTGSTWTDLLTIKDNGNITAKTLTLTNHKFLAEKMSETAADLTGTTTANVITFYSNGFAIPNPGIANDGGIFRVKGSGESDTIVEIGAYDDSGAGETIQFNYYPTTSRVTPTYSIAVPKKSGTIALTSDSYSKTDADAKYVTALGTNSNYVTWTKNGTTNNLTVPYATKANYPNGFTSQTSAFTWGTLGNASNGYSKITGWQINGGEIDFATKNSQLFIQTNGAFYQNEGRYVVLDSNSVGNGILTGYTIATSDTDIAATDSLNTALGKLQKKLNTTYDLVKTAADNDGTIENLQEVLKVLSGISDTDTITALLDKYLPLTGGKLTGQLYINRGATSASSLRWNKSGSYWGGIGYNGTSNTNYFGPTDINGAWVSDTSKDIWKFGGSVNITNNLTVNGSTTFNVGEGLTISEDKNYFGTNFDARIISIIDGNAGTNGLGVDGGLIINMKGYQDGSLNATTELLRIRNYNGSDEFQWKKQNIYHAGNLVAGTNISLSTTSGKTSIINTGVRSISTGTTNGTISVNTNGTSANVAVKGLGSNAYTSVDYLPLAGGTMDSDAVIQRTATSVSWINGRSASMIKTTNVAGYGPIISLKTSNGDWSIGHYVHQDYYDKLLFTYCTDTNYNAQKNSITTQIIFDSSGNISASKFTGTLNNTLTFSAGTFSTKSYNNSSAITVNVPTQTSHLTNNSGYITKDVSDLTYYVKKSGDTMTGVLASTYGVTHAGFKVGSSYINYLSDSLLLQNTPIIRFGTDAWDWNQWAGLKYDHSSKTIYLGIADGTTFTANSAQSGGSLRFPGISTVYATTFNGNLSGTADVANKLGTSTVGSNTQFIYLSGGTPTASSWKINTGSDPFGTIPVVRTDGVMEIGHYIDFHYDNTTKSDFSTRLHATGNYSNTVSLPSSTGTLALTSQIPTVTNYYWANVKVSSSSNTTTTPTFGLTTVSSLFVNTGDSTLKIYSGKTADGVSDGHIGLQTCIDTKDGETHDYASSYQARNVLALQPRGGEVYIGTMPNGGDTNYKLYVNGTGYITSSLRVGGYNNTSYALSADSAIINSWIRTTGSTGWYNETYAGGWYMIDSTWIRSFNNKSIYQNAGILRTDGTLQVGHDGKYLYANSSKFQLFNYLTVDTNGCMYPTNTAKISAGLYGVYSSTRLGHIWSMGTGYKISDDGLNPNTLCGFAYFHTNWSNSSTYNTAYASKTALGTYAGNHQAGWFINGVLQGAIGDYVWSRSGFKKNGSSDSYILLGGGGHTALSGLFTNLSNSGNNISITIGGTNKTLTPAYATSATKLNVGDNVTNSTLKAGYSGGVCANTVYKGNFPATYGNVLSVFGTGDTQIFMQWNDAQSKAGEAVANHLWVRARRDSIDATTANAWSGWTAIVDEYNEYTINVTKLTSTVTPSTTWQDTGISSSNLPANGTYIVQMYSADTSDQQWYVYYSGIMSWYRTDTNDSDSDEIQLHAAGHAYGKRLYLRTIHTATNNGGLKLQIAADVNFSGTETITFKFKRII